MTTILTDGKILLADTRTTTTHADGRKTWADKSVKLLDLRLKQLKIGATKERKVLAVGFAGNSTSRPIIFGILRTIPKETNLLPYLRVVTRNPGDLGDCTLIFVCEDGYIHHGTLSWGKEGYTLNCSEIKLQEGHFYGAGTGFTIAKGLGRASTKQTLQRLFMASVYLDSSSSSRYTELDLTDEKSTIQTHRPDNDKVMTTVRGVLRSVAADPDLSTKTTRYDEPIDPLTHY